VLVADLTQLRGPSKRDLVPMIRAIRARLALLRCARHEQELNRTERTASVMGSADTANRLKQLLGDRISS